MQIAKFDLTKLSSPFLDFFLPPTCLSCDALLNDGSVKVCDTCWNSIQRLSRGHSLYIDTHQRLVEAGAVGDLVSCFVFEKEGALQTIAHGLKYSGFESLGVELGRRIGDVMDEWDVNADLAIPVPLHKRKFRERGYNQAEAIACGIAANTSIRTNEKILQRKKYTQTQTKLNLDQRKENMEEAFEVVPKFAGELKGKTILLVDDVITTGATITSCAAELLDAGAVRVIAASAALAQKDAGV